MAGLSTKVTGLSLLVLFIQASGLSNKDASKSNDSSDVPRVAVAGTSLGGRAASQAAAATPLKFPNEAPESSGSSISSFPFMVLLLVGVGLGFLQTKQGQEIAASFGIVAPEGQWTKMPLKDLESGSLLAMAQGLPLVNQAVGALGGWVPAFRRAEHGMEMEPALNGCAYSDAGSDCDLPEAELKVRLNDPWEAEESETPKQQCLLPDFDPSEMMATTTEAEASEHQAPADPWGFPPMQKLSLDDMGLFDQAAKPAGSQMDDFFDDDDDF